MKKLYSIFVMLVALMAFQVSAYNIYVRVDASNRVEYWGTMSFDEVPLNEGVNTIDCGEDAGYISFMPSSEDYMITSLVNVTTGETVQDEYGQYMVELTSANADNMFEITTASVSDMMTGRMSVFVDDASMVSCFIMGTYREVTFEDGWNEFAYIPESEYMMMITAADWDRQLYRVAVDGQDVVPDGDYFYVDIAEGAKVEIFSAFPEGDSKVSFQFVNEGTEGCVDGVRLNGEDVENWLAGFDCKLGDGISISFNTEMYNVEKLELNGNEVDFWGQLSFVAALPEYTVTVTAAKVSTFNVTVDVDNPEAVHVFVGSVGGSPLSLTSGVNSVEVPDNEPKVYVRAASAICDLSEVSVNGQAAEFVMWMNAYEMEVKADDAVVIRATMGSRDKVAYVWVDDPSKAPYGCGMARADGSNWDDSEVGTLAAGYNKVSFCDKDNPFELGFWGLTEFAVYDCAGQLVAPAYEEANYCSVALTDGGVAKAFLCGTPQAKTVTFAVINAEPKVTYDKILSHDPAGALTAYPGTEVVVEGEGFNVTLDGTELAAEGGAYTFTVSGDHTVAITGESGVKDIVMGGKLTGDVYNLQGQRVARDGDTSRLPAGLYLVGGKKVVVK